MMLSLKFLFKNIIVCDIFIGQKISPIMARRKKKGAGNRTNNNKKKLRKYSQLKSFKPCLIYIIH